MLAATRVVVATADDSLWTRLSQKGLRSLTGGLILAHITTPRKRAIRLGLELVSVTCRSGPRVSLLASHGGHSAAIDDVQPGNAPLRFAQGSL